MEFFYYYTTAATAKTIVLAGAIPPSLEASGDYVPHGDGVYLTTLDPSYGRNVIMENNWGSDVEGNDRNMIEVYIKVMMQTRMIVRAEDRRDIQVHDGPLELSDYQWSLRSFSGALLATEHFKVSSVGEAAVLKSSLMGRYRLMRNVVTHGGFVYEKEEGGSYLYKNAEDAWIVGKNLYKKAEDAWIVGHEDAELCQEFEDDSLEHTWLYKLSTGEWKVDPTLTINTCYLARDS